MKLVADAKYLELLGGHLIGPDVSELLPELTLAQKWDLGALELARNVHTHPTLSEALQEAFHGLAGHMINMYGHRRCARRIARRAEVPIDAGRGSTGRRGGCCDATSRHPPRCSIDAAGQAFLPRRR